MNSESTGSLTSVLYLNQLQKTVSDACTNIKKINGSENILPFSQILSEVSEKVNTVNDMFQTLFPKYSVQTKVGNCDVPWESWDRNDFPVWNYFKKNTSAECLNNWMGVGPEPPQWDRGVQQGLRQIKSGEMVILMPKSLQKKMESNPEFAQEVLNRVKKWKEDYDREDNALAASYGYDPELHQFSKSYCIQLDEEGNVGYHVVIGGGGDKRSEDSIKVDKENDLIGRIAGMAKKKETLATDNVIRTGNYSIDFENAAPYLMDLRLKKKQKM